jgi:hypothetical protein
MFMRTHLAVEGFVESNLVTHAVRDRSDQIVHVCVSVCVRGAGFRLCCRTTVRQCFKFKWRSRDRVIHADQAGLQVARLTVGRARWEQAAASQVVLVTVPPRRAPLWAVRVMRAQQKRLVALRAGVKKERVCE